MTLLTVLLAGFLLGMKHATEADHLAAVATLVARQRTYARTLLQGVAWGIGHTLALMACGAAVLILGRSIPSDLAQAFELAVGILLFLLGADLLRRLARRRMHFHLHRHGSQVAHVHAHSHGPDEGDHAATLLHGEQPHDHDHGLPLRALAVGTMHGLAGSAALVLLSLDAVPTWELGLVYIAVFGIGSIAGMALLSIAIAIPLRWSAGRLAWLHNGAHVALALVSCVLGAWFVYEIGFARGLLVG